MSLNVGSIVGFVGADNSAYLSAVNETIRAGARMAKTMERQFKAAGQSMQRMGTTMSVAVTVPLAALSVAADKTSLSLDRADKRLEFATGSATGAAEAMSFITSEVDRLGISLMPSIEGFSNFAAAAKGTSLEGQGTRDVFTGMSQAAATLGLEAEQTAGAMKALEQIMSKGTVQAEELRGQLGERIPGAFQIASRAMGVTTQELGKMLEMGEVLAEDFLPKFAAELKRTFTGAVPASVRALNEFSNSFILFKKSLADAGITRGLMRMRIAATELMKQFIALDLPTKQMAIKFAGIAAIIPPILFFGGKMIAMLGSLIGVAASVASGFVPMLAGIAGLIVPLAAVALGVALLLDAFGSLLPSMKSVGGIFGWFKGVLKNVADFFGEFKDFLLGGTKGLSDGTKTAIEFIAKTWLSLKIAWNAVVVGLQTVVKGITDGLSFLLEKMAAVADMAPGFSGVADKARAAAAALGKFSVELGNARDENTKTLADMVGGWGRAPEILQKDFATFQTIVKEIGESALEGIKDLAPEAVNKIMDLIKQINAALAAGEAGSIQLPMDQLGPTPAMAPPQNILDVGGTSGLDLALQREKLNEHNGLLLAMDFEGKDALAKQELEFFKASAGGWDKWAMSIGENFDSISTRSINFGVSLVKGLSSAFGQVLSTTATFAEKMTSLMLAMGQKMLDETITIVLQLIAYYAASAKARAAMTAPTPWLIPVYMAAAAGFFAVGMANTIVGSSSAGGGAAAAVADPIVQEAQFSRVETGPPTVDDDFGESGGSGGRTTERLIITTDAGEQLLDVLVRETINGKGTSSDRFATTRDIDV